MVSEVDFAQSFRQISKEEFDLPEALNHRNILKVLRPWAVLRSGRVGMFSGDLLVGFFFIMIGWFMSILKMKI